MFRWQDWLLTPARAAVHVPFETAVVADLHLGYAEARRRSGEAVPLPSVSEQLAPLAALVRERGLRRMVVAGDLFEAGVRPEIVGQLLAWLDEVGVADFTLVPGNHDRGLRSLPARLKQAGESFALGDWLVVHGDRQRPDGSVVQGHLHPCLRVVRGRPGVPCFLASSNHLVLPAYCAEASGADVRSDERWTGYRCLAIARGGVLDVGDLPIKERTGR
jgi:putative SbcD/Mre11-related phosphoesterase